MADPLHQFQIQKIVDLPDVTLPFVTDNLRDFAPFKGLTVENWS